MRTFDDYLKHLEQERPDLIQGMLEEEQRMDAKKSLQDRRIQQPTDRCHEPTSQKRTAKKAASVT